NGTDVSPTLSKTGDTTSARLASAAPFPPGALNSVEVTFTTGGNSLSREWSFTVENYLTLPVALGTAPGSGKDQGFSVRTYQVEATLDNTDAGSEAVLAGNKGANIADLSQFTNTGFFNETGVINYNEHPD